MAVELKLTQKLVDGLDFHRPILKLDPQGHPTFAKTAGHRRDWRIRDTELVGLQVRITPGSIGWYVRRRMGIHGDQLRCLGSHPELSLTKARARAQQWLAMMAQGLDPLVEKKKHQLATKAARTRDKQTLGVVFDEFVEATRSKVKPSTTTDRLKVKKWMSSAPIWHTPFADITRDVVAESLEPLRAHVMEGKKLPTWGPASVTGSTVQKIYTWLNGAYQRGAANLDLRRGRGEGPFAQWRAEVAWPDPVRRETYLPTNKPQGRDWLKALVELQRRMHDPKVLGERADPRSKDIKPHQSVMVDYFVLVLLWGTRKVETARLKWSEVHFDERMVFLAPETTKSGELAAIPLTTWATDILKERKANNERWRPDETSEWVFPSRQHGKSLADPRNILEDVCAETGLWITAHDLRRTMATEMTMGVQMEQVAKMLLAGAALHHAQGSTGGKVSAATLGYLMEKAESMRPMYQERENRLRTIAGLPIEESAPKVAEASTDDLLRRALEDPAFKRAYLAELAKG